MEVSTFRGPAANDAANATHKDDHGRLLRDNVFGTQEEDAIRRDFTVNALFYDPTTQQILDYRGGVEDLQQKRLRMIGDPELRYREDPVRMLRAVRLAAKLGLEIEPGTRKPIKALSTLLAERARRASLRGDAEAAPFRARRRMCASNCARKDCIRGCCRCST